MKKIPGKYHSKTNNYAVRGRIRRLWDNGYSRARISKELSISLSTVQRITEKWKTRCFSAPSRKRNFDYHIAYCLLYEHGLTFKEAAFALEVNVGSLRQTMRRNKAIIEETHAAWIVWYKEERRKSMPRNLYSREIALKLAWENKTEEEKQKQKEINKLASIKSSMLRETCPYCGTTSTKAVIARLHLNNCKKKEAELLYVC